MAKKITPLLFFFFILFRLGYSQKVDSILKFKLNLKTASNDSVRVDNLVKLCSHYRFSNPDSSIHYGQWALELSKKIHYQKGEVGALSFMSITEEQLGNLTQAFQMAFTALQIGKDHDLENLTGAALNALGETCILLKDYSRALGYLKKEKAIALHSGIKESLAYSNLDLGMTYTGLKQLDSAQMMENEAKRIFQEIHFNEPLVDLAYGDIELNRKKPESALKFYTQGLDSSLRTGQHRATAYAYDKLAFYYYGLNNTQLATDYAQKCLQESKAISQRNTLLESANLLSEIYESKSPAQSLYYLKVADTYKSWLFGASNIQAIQTIINQQTEHEREIEKERVAYQNRVIQYAFLAGILVLLIIAFILYRNFKQKQKANILLENTLKDLQARQAQLIQSEKMASLGELMTGIAHEIQNPLNFINNFSELNTDLIQDAKNEIHQGNPGDAADILNDLEENGQKINHHGKRAESIVRSMLQHSRKSGNEKELTDINELANEYLRLSYHGLKAKDDAFHSEIETHFDASIKPIKVIPVDLGRVFQNLYNNAFYAVHERKLMEKNGFEPKVILSTQKLNGKIQIKVMDNGKGIPQNLQDKIFQPFFTTKPTGKGTGLGLSLSYDIIKANGGEIQVNSLEGQGAEFIIFLPA